MSADSKNLVVIGGSRGIGAATARLAARSSYRVAIGFHEQRAAAEAIAREIAGQGGEAVALPVDVADVASVDSFFGRVLDSYGVPDAVAHCAGVRGPHGPLIDLRPEDITALFNTNLIGAFYCVKVACSKMALSRGGRGGAMVMLSSEAARFGGDRISPYAASKAGINAMIVAAARELARDGIRLNAVSPGVIETDQQAHMSESQRAAMLSTIPAGRLGHPEEVAKAMLWLLSDDASYVAGSILTVAGGR